MTTKGETTNAPTIMQSVSDEIRGTSPWVTFFGWMGIIGSVIALAFGGVGLVANLTDASGGNLFGYLGSAFVIAAAGVGFYISVKLRAVSGALKLFSREPTQDQLVNAITLHNSYWRAAALAAVLLAVANIVAFGITYTQS